MLDGQSNQAALMARMLELGHSTPLMPNAKLPDDILLGLNRENLCPMPAEFGGYKNAHPKEGMPLAVTGLTDVQYQTLQQWLANGAPVDQMPVQGVIVHKTHITYPMGSQKLARVKELFYSGNWHAQALPGYGPTHRANPFETFKEIPTAARYQFMLDNAEFFVRTFIRGPLCRGQIATDVIRDHFWTLFQAPDHDRYITDAAYRAKATPLLAMPGQDDDVGSVLSLWLDYRNKRNAYESLRSDAYAQLPPPGWAALWQGNDNALLTIFRHFDSASVNKGLIGDLPESMWLFDYPLLERTYYQLAVNFDVYGNVSHQVQTRLYLDLIRNGAEVNFLRLMPAEKRDDILSGSYQEGGKVKMWLDYRHIDDDTPTGIALDEKAPKRDFERKLVQREGHLTRRLTRSIAASAPIVRARVSVRCSPTSSKP